MKLIKKAIFASVMMLSFSSLHSEPNPAVGNIRGKILDEEQNPLPGAFVTLDDNRYTAVTDIEGNYLFSGINPGSHAISVTYLGFSPKTMSVNLAAGSTCSGNMTMSASTQGLEEVVVTGVFTDQQRAINMQKGNVNVTNVVSSDQIGKFPDSNIGDALKRISGINVQYDQGEARFGQVRGTSPDLSSVTINGSRIPSAEGDIRNVQLDLIPSDMIQTIEVNKTLLSDQDGDAIGGSINLITKTSPTHRVISASAGSGYNFISDKARLDLGFTFGDRYFGDRLGMIVAASYANAPSGSYDTEFLWEKTDEGEVYVNDYQIRRYYVTRERQSYSLALDWKFNHNNTIWFKGIFNNRNDWENRYRMTLKGLDQDGKATVRIQTKGGSSDNRDARLERQRTMDFSLGGNHLAGKFEIDWKAGYARASEERPNERYIDYQLKKQKFDVDLSDPRQPYATPQEGYTYTLNDDFSLKELTEQQEEIVEEDLKGALNVSARVFDNLKVKIGAKFVRKTKSKDIDFYEYTPIDEEAFKSEAFGNITNQTTSSFMPSSKYASGLYIDKSYLGSLNLNDGTYEKSQVAEELAGNYDARETVSSGYARFDYRLTKSLNVIAGVRLENTDIRYTGRIYDDEKDVVTITEPATSSYLNFLPSLLIKYDVNKDMVLRLGYNKSLARPKYSALVPGVNISRSDNEVKIGNPELSATTAHNIDLNAEYYFRSIGLASLGMFYKRINGFIVDEVSMNKEYMGTVWTKFTQPKNAGDANLYGLEASFQRNFDFISPSLRCVGFYGTYTYTHSNVKNFNFEG
ncbi:MAG: TonB-dependent receptor, partial [Muribaculaceae bacterium]